MVVMNFIRFKIGIISWVLIIVCMYICENHIYKNGAEEKYEAAQDSNLERYGVYGENVPIPYNIPLEEIAEKIEYLYTYEKMLCEVSASSRYEELEPLPEGRMRMTIYMAEGNKVLFLPEGAGNKEVLINGELCKLYYSEEREGYLFYFIDDCEENEGGVPVNAVGNGGWEEWFGVCIMEGESQPYSDSRYYTYYPRFDFASLYKIGEIEVNLDAQKQISLPDIDVQGNEYIESMIRAVQRTLAEKENYGDFEMYLGTYGRMSYGRNGNLTVFKASGCVVGKDLEQYFYFTIYDACPEGIVISAAVPYYPPSEQEYESGKYYFTGGEWLPVANQEERIQKIKEMERVAIPFTVIEGEDYEDGEEHEVCDGKEHEEAEKIDFGTMSTEEAINMISYLYSYSEWFGMNELGCPVGEVRGLKDKELIMYADNSGEWLYFIPADKVNEVFVCEDGREYPIYINEEGNAEFYSIKWNPAAVSGDGGEEYYVRYLIVKSQQGKYYFWPAGFGLNGSLEECSAERHHMNAVCIERTKQLERRESVLSITPWRKRGGKRYWSCQYFPCDIQTHIRPGFQSPFYQPDVHMFYLKAGNAVRVYAAPAVVIIRIALRKGGAVCMPCDQDVVFLLCPVVQALLRFISSCIIFGSAGRV